MEEELVKLRLKVPEDAVGRVLGELSNRGGWIDAMNRENGSVSVEARAPVIEIPDYKRWFEKYTNGKGELVVV